MSQIEETASLDGDRVSRWLRLLVIVAAVPLTAEPLLGLARYGDNGWVLSALFPVSMFSILTLTTVTWVRTRDKRIGAVMWGTLAITAALMVLSQLIATGYASPPPISISMLTTTLTQLVIPPMVFVIRWANGSDEPMAAIPQPPPPAPEPTAVYRAYGADLGRPLYIGCTNNPEFRTVQHLKEKPWWAAEVRHTDVRWYPTKESAREAERRAIWDEKPVHNDKGQRPSLRRARTSL